MKNYSWDDLHNFFQGKIWPLLQLILPDKIELIGHGDSYYGRPSSYISGEAAVYRVFGWITRVSPEEEDRFADLPDGMITLRQHGESIRVAVRYRGSVKYAYEYDSKTDTLTAISVI